MSKTHKVTLGDLAWDKGFKIASKIYPYDDSKDLKKPAVRSRRISENIRTCRIFALGFEKGWMDGYRAGLRKRK